MQITFCTNKLTTEISWKWIRNPIMITWTGVFTYESNAQQLKYSILNVFWFFCREKKNRAIRICGGTLFILVVQLLKRRQWRRLGWNQRGGQRNARQCAYRSKWVAFASGWNVTGRRSQGQKGRGRWRRGQYSYLWFKVSPLLKCNHICFLFCRNAFIEGAIVEEHF